MRTHACSLAFVLKGNVRGVEQLKVHGSVYNIAAFQVRGGGGCLGRLKWSEILQQFRWPTQGVVGMCNVGWSEAD